MIPSPPRHGSADRQRPRVTWRSVAVLAAILALGATPFVARAIAGGPVEAADVESTPDVRPAWPTEGPAGVLGLGAELLDAETAVDTRTEPDPEPNPEPAAQSALSRGDLFEAEVQAAIETTIETAIAVLTDTYTWDERGTRVEELQRVLGVPVDGWYGQSTLSAHRSALESAGLPTDRVPVAPGPSAEQWASLRECESGGDYAITNPSGRYRGAYQFDRSTWNSVAERSAPRLVGVDPAAASPADQDAMALALYGERGPRPWPNCGRHLR